MGRGGNDKHDASSAHHDGFVFTPERSWFHLKQPTCCESVCIFPSGRFAVDAIFFIFFE